MGNIDDVLKQRFQSYAEFKTNLAEWRELLIELPELVDTNRDTIAGR
jgi:hypothetical protein